MIPTRIATDIETDRGRLRVEQYRRTDGELPVHRF
jgi:hypothetical protein